jgi:hypothetical protein
VWRPLVYFAEDNEGNEGVLDPRISFGFRTPFPSLTSFPSVKNPGIATSHFLFEEYLTNFAFVALRAALD